MRENLNKSVPDSTIIRHLKNYISVLEEENSRLRNSLNNKEKAIKAFKEWQSKVADYKVTYWLNEGIKLLSEETKKEIGDIKSFRKFFTDRKSYHKMYKDLKNAYDILLSKYIKLTENGSN